MCHDWIMGQEGQHELNWVNMKIKIIIIIILKLNLGVDPGQEVQTWLTWVNI